MSRLRCNRNLLMPSKRALLAVFDLTLKKSRVAIIPEYDR